MEAFSGQLRAAADLAGNTTPAGNFAFYKREADQRWSLRFTGTVATLRANLTLGSTGFRHAIRLAVCIALGEVLSHILKLQRSYWLPMTVGLVLKPEFAATFSRGLLRIVGTIAGLLLATALFHFLPSSIGVEIGLIAAFMFLVRWAGAANYGIFTLAVSGLVVLMIAVTGVAPKEVILARGMNTVIGGMIALVAYWVWPTWEKPHVSEAMAGMLDGYRAYFHAVAEVCARDAKESCGELDRLRLAGRVGRSRTQVSADRLDAEPGTTEDQRMLLSATRASSNRFAHAVMALEAAGAQASLPRNGKLFKILPRMWNGRSLSLPGFYGEPVSHKRSSTRDDGGSSSCPGCLRRAPPLSKQRKADQPPEPDPLVLGVVCLRAATPRGIDADLTLTKAALFI